MQPSFFLYNKKELEKKIKENNRNLCHRETSFGPGISRPWNSFILAAIRADISGSCRSEADSVWNSYGNVGNVWLRRGKVMIEHINFWFIEIRKKRQTMAY
jgi:hypothetical protein